MTVESVSAYFESQGIDANGLENTARNFMAYLARHVLGSLTGPLDQGRSASTPLFPF